ncbi:MAG: malonate transporter subunit MadL [Ruminococcaceae bacterium]|nr:malonate transporter subunit MadL [Oscillospiraceae bacterium]
MIYGVAILSACMFIGTFIGNLLGLATGLNSDVGGVGFAMLLLLIITNSKKVTEKLPANYEKGLNFWKEMFIPVIIAMAASQNVFGAISGGVLAAVAGIASVAVAFLMLPLLNSLIPKASKKKAEAEVEQ